MSFRSIMPTRFAITLLFLFLLTLPFFSSTLAASSFFGSIPSSGATVVEDDCSTQTPYSLMAMYPGADHYPTIYTYSATFNDTGATDVVVHIYDTPSINAHDLSQNRIARLDGSGSWTVTDAVTYYFLVVPKCGVGAGGSWALLVGGPYSYWTNVSSGLPTPNASVPPSSSGKPASNNVIQVEPPPAPLCSNTNFEEPGIIRSHFNSDVDTTSLHCRLVASNGNILSIFGNSIATIGSQNVLNLEVLAAADVFSMAGVTQFVDDVNICLKGTGSVIFMNANDAPRYPQMWEGWTTDAFPGYTCATLHTPGTVVLVANAPQ
jgi:hypothetical protein